MLLHLQKLSIQTVQNTREIAGALFVTCIVPIATAWAKGPVAAGKAYSEQVKGYPGHQLGAPWPHVAHALLQGILDRLLKSGPMKE